jgi:uncharacterized membrane protein
MIEGWLFVLTLAAALGCGLVAGALYAFSSFVMRALARLPVPQGIAAMQAINLEAPTAPFMAGFVGTAALSVAVVAVALFNLGESYAVYLLVGGLLYLVGVIGLTGAYHIPRNDALAAMEPNSAEAASYWARYVKEWTAWNHVRVLAGLAAAGVLIGAIRVG